MLKQMLTNTKDELHNATAHLNTLSAEFGNIKCLQDEYIGRYIIEILLIRILVLINYSISIMVLKEWIKISIGSHSTSTVCSGFSGINFKNDIKLMSRIETYNKFRKFSYLKSTYNVVKS